MLLYYSGASFHIEGETVNILMFCNTSNQKQLPAKNAEAKYYLETKTSLIGKMFSLFIYATDVG